MSTGTLSHVKTNDPNIEKKRRARASAQELKAKIEEKLENYPDLSKEFDSWKSKVKLNQCIPFTSNSRFFLRYKNMSEEEKQAQRRAETDARKKHDRAVNANLPRREVKAAEDHMRNVESQRYEEVVWTQGNLSLIAPDISVHRKFRIFSLIENNLGIEIFITEHELTGSEKISAVLKNLSFYPNTITSYPSGCLYKKSDHPERANLYTQR